MNHKQPMGQLIWKHTLINLLIINIKIKAIASLNTYFLNNLSKDIFLPKNNTPEIITKHGTAYLPKHLQ